MDRETKNGFIAMTVMLVGVFVFPLLLKTMGAW